ncbi:IS66 family transposase, partial [Bacteroides thetaiotaomicron]
TLLTRQDFNEFFFTHFLHSLFSGKDRDLKIQRQRVLYRGLTNGLRARKVLTDYIKPDYRGAIQCDGFSDYKTLETKEYPHVIHLACFQHCKRKFLDIQANKDAQRVIEIINRLYRKEHEIPLEYTFGQILEYRKE